MSKDLTPLTYSLESIPMITLPKLCNPCFCDGQHERRITPERLEELLSLYIKGFTPGNTLNALFANRESLQFQIISLIKSLAQQITDSNILAASNAPSLKSFRVEMGGLLKNELDTSLKTGSNPGEYISLMSHFGFFMVGLGEIRDVAACLSSVSAGDLSRRSSIYLDSPNLIFQLLRMRCKIKIQKWSGQKNENFLNLVAGEIKALLITEVASSPLSRWLDFILSNIPSTRLIQFSYACRSLDESTRMDRIKTGIESQTPVPLQAGLRFWMEAELRFKQGGEREALFAGFFAQGKRRRYADKYATAKNYQQAIEFYEILNFHALGDPQMIVQSLTNCAALRLRVFVDQPRLAPFIVLECTMALEIDPVNVKALFRRGLALALCKKWNEAIVDFERALELDPNSPAKKELEVARRQVIRRIGN